MRASALLIVAAAGFSSAAAANVYTCTDAEGRTVFRDMPCDKQERPRAVEETERGKRSRRAAPSEGATLEHDEVKRLVARLDRAMTKRDVKAVAALLAKDAEVELVIEGSDAAAAPPMDRTAFSGYLSAAFARPDYVYQSVQVRISVSKRKLRATVNRTLREGVLVSGRVIVTDVRERLTVEPTGRRLLIRKLRKVAVAPVGMPERHSAVPGLSSALGLLAQQDQDDQQDDAGGHRDIEQ